jgi:hypothetical protein
MIFKPPDKTWIASFDIGKINFAFCIEEFDTAQLLNIKNIEKSLRFKSNFSPSDRYDAILHNIYNNGNIILFKNSDLRKNTEPGVYWDPEFCDNMTELLDEYTDYWDNCSAFIVEEQMKFRGKVNPPCLKLGQHCISYFRILYKRFKTVVEFPSYHKTNVLGAPRTLTKSKRAKGKDIWKTLGDKERKNWAIVKAQEILTLRNDTETLNLFTPKPRKKGVKKIKLDDLSDTLLMIQAFKYLAYVADEL